MDKEIKNLYVRCLDGQMCLKVEDPKIFQVLEDTIMLRSDNTIIDMFEDQLKQMLNFDMDEIEKYRNKISEVLEDREEE